MRAAGTFTKASVRIKRGASNIWNSGSEPEIRPLIAPSLGFGSVPTQDLPAFYAGVAVDLTGNVAGEFSTGLSYRQISLLRNPTRDTSATSTSASGGAADDEPTSGDGTYAQKEAYDALKRIRLSGTPDLSAVTAGDVIEDISAGVNDGVEPVAARAFVDYVDNTNKYIYSIEFIYKRVCTRRGTLSI